ncbi:MAG: hypothetical protein ACP5QN_01155, partial [Minisyncoccia bacterium]
MRIAILGFGKEGKAILNFLKKDKKFKKSEVWILDQNLNLILPKNLPKNIKFQLGKNYLKNLNQFNIIFRSPG